MKLKTAIACLLPIVALAENKPFTVEIIGIDGSVMTTISNVTKVVPNHEPACTLVVYDKTNTFHAWMVGVRRTDGKMIAQGPTSIGYEKMLREAVGTLTNDIIVTNLLFTNDAVTNFWALTNSTSPGNYYAWVDGNKKVNRLELKELVEKLCREGEVCKLKGHQWVTEVNVTAYETYGQRRHCAICNLWQSKPESEWR